MRKDRITSLFVSGALIAMMAVAGAPGVSAQAAPTATLTVDVTAGAADPAPASNFDFTVTVSNTGSATAHHIELQLFAGGLTINSVVSSDPTDLCDFISGTFVECGLQALDPGATNTFTVDVTRGNGSAAFLQASTNDRDPHTSISNGFDQVQIPIHSTLSADLQLSKTQDVANPTFGQAFSYTYTVTNVGTNTVSSVTLEDNPFPSRATFVQFDVANSTAGVTCPTTPNLTSQILTCDLGSIAGGATKVVVIDVTRSATSPKEFQNSAEVFDTTNGTDFDPSPGNNFDSVSTPIEPTSEADLTVQLVTSDPDPASAGAGTFDVTMNVINLGDNPVDVDATLSLGGAPVEVENIVAPAGWSCTPISFPAVVTSVDCVSTGQPDGPFPETHQIVVTLDRTGNAAFSLSADVIDNDAGEESDPADFNNNDGFLFFQLAPDVRAALNVTKTHSPADPANGSQFTYQITTTNSGPAASGAVTLTDNLPGQVTFVSTDRGGVCTHLSGTVTCNFTSIPNGGTEVVNITVTRNVDTAFSNSATASDGTNSDSGSDFVNSLVPFVPTPPQSADFALGLGMSADSTVGGPVQYIATVTNNGPDATTGQVLLSLPGTVDVPATLPANCFNQALQAVECDIVSPLASGQSITFAIDTVRASAGPAVADGSVDPNLTDPDVANNYGSGTVGSAPVTVEPTSSPAPEPTATPQPEPTPCEGDADNLCATPENDVLTVEGDGTTLFAGGGADDITVVGDNVTIHAGGGDDEVVVEGDNATVLGGTGDDDVDINGLDGTVDGGADDDDICGGPGEDDLNGSGGRDSICGGGANDDISGGGEADALFGDSPGADGAAAMRAYADGQSLSADQVAALDVAASAALGADTLRGGLGQDLVVGAGGRDSIFGGFGSDFLRGGVGNDELAGSDGSDEINGGDGDDRIRAGAGRNRVRAGQGIDVCILNLKDSATGCETEKRRGHLRRGHLTFGGWTEGREAKPRG